LAKDLESLLFDCPDDVIVSIVGHVPVIDPSQFLFLSGFTYFLGAWIDFEQTARRLVEPQDGFSRPIVGHRLVRELNTKGLLEREEIEMVFEVSEYRNYLAHGDSDELPPKARIDQLVLLTEKLKRAIPASHAGPRPHPRTLRRPRPGG
jgi:hypothetical protein